MTPIDSLRYRLMSPGKLEYVYTTENPLLAEVYEEFLVEEHRNIVIQLAVDVLVDYIMEKYYPDLRG
jgi:hypothetical protein